MLSNAYFLAKFRFDRAENEPAKKLQKMLLLLSRGGGFMVKRKIPSLLQARALDDLARSHETQLVPDDYEKVTSKEANEY